MTLALPLPRPEVRVLRPCAAPEAEWLSTLEAATYLRVHEDTVRKRARSSWAGRGPRLHGHHSSDGSTGGVWLFPRAGLEVFARGGDLDAQVRACGPSCPEAATNVSALRPPTGPSARAAHRSPGRRR